MSYETSGISWRLVTIFYSTAFFVDGFSLGGKGLHLWDIIVVDSHPLLFNIYMKLLRRNCAPFPWVVGEMLLLFYSKVWKIYCKVLYESLVSNSTHSRWSPYIGALLLCQCYLWQTNTTQPRADLWFLYVLMDEKLLPEQQVENLIEEDFCSALATALIISLSGAEGSSNNNSCHVFKVFQDYLEIAVSRECSSWWLNWLVTMGACYNSVIALWISMSSFWSTIENVDVNLVLHVWHLGTYRTTSSEWIWMDPLYYICRYFLLSCISRMSGEPKLRNWVPHWDQTTFSKTFGSY